MPVADSGKVLVTGANGFVAIWVIDALLRQGYAVRAVVRSAGKGIHLTQVFARYGDKLEIAVVEDFTAEGAFDKAIKGIDAVMHVAAAVYVHPGDPNEVILPAVKGTTSLLNSVITYGSSVKRVVYTSSCGAVLTPGSEPKVYNEGDWNDFAVQQCQEHGADVHGMWKYCASKVLTERAAWEIYEQNKADGTWDLVVITPPWVFGPVTLHAVLTPEELNGSELQWYNGVFKSTKSGAELIETGDCWIDVRDLAVAHMKAITAPEAGGERIIVSAGPWKWPDWINAARHLSDKAIDGDPSYDHNTAIHKIDYDVSKMKRILGLQVRSIAETTADIVRSFELKGWLT